MKKNIVIDGDVFQEEYKKRQEKTQIYGLLQGILFLIISIAGLFFESKILLKIVILLFPLSMFIYAARLLSIAYGIFKLDKSIAYTYLLQGVLMILGGGYILFNPLESLNVCLTAIGIIIIINSVLKMTYMKSYLPVGSIILGILLMLFPAGLIDTFYKIFLVFLLIYSIGKISQSIQILKNK